MRGGESLRLHCGWPSRRSRTESAHPGARRRKPPPSLRHQPKLPSLRRGEPVRGGESLRLHCGIPVVQVVSVKVGECAEAKASAFIAAAPFGQNLCTPSSFASCAEAKASAFIAASGLRSGAGLSRRPGARRRKPPPSLRRPGPRRRTPPYRVRGGESLRLHCGHSRHSISPSASVRCAEAKASAFIAACGSRPMCCAALWVRGGESLRLHCGSTVWAGPVAAFVARARRRKPPPSLRRFLGA